MPPLNPLNARMYSKLGQRGSCALTLEEIAAQDDELMVLTADLATLTGLTRFKEKFPKKFLNVGIAEQNMIGIAAGMAKEGKTVFATTYSNFLAMRSYEQIRNHLGYMNFNVKVIGSGSGFAMGMSGNTHYGLEDIALMRVIPGLMVISPADGGETMKAVWEAAKYHGPVYIRLTGAMNAPVVYHEEYQFIPGKSILLRNGTDITIIATGSMVHHALESAKILELRGISASVINMHTIKPLDTDAVNTACVSSKLIVTVEEHSVIGGLGGAVAEYLCGRSPAPRQLIIGIPDAFQKPGDYQYLLEQNCLTGSQIAEKITFSCNSLVHS